MRLRLAIIGGLLAALALAVVFYRSNGGARQPLRVGYYAGALTSVVVKDIQTNQRLAPDHVVFVPFASPAALNGALAGGQIDINLNENSYAVALARASGHKVLYLQPTIANSTHILVRPDSTFHSLSDLKGKTLGWIGSRTGIGASFIILARGQGLDPLKDIKGVDAPPATLPALLERSEVDAIIAFEPLASRLILNGKARSLFGPFYVEWKSMTGHPLELTGMAVREEALEAQHAYVDELLSAWRSAVTEVSARPLESLHASAQSIGVVEESVIQSLASELPDLLVSEWGPYRDAIPDFLARIDGLALEPRITGVDILPPSK